MLSCLVPFFSDALQGRMTMLPRALRPGIRFKKCYPALLAALVFLFFGGASWHLVPVSPRLTLQIGPHGRIVAFSPDSASLATVIQGSENTFGRICLWDVATGEQQLSLADDW